MLKLAILKFKREDDLDPVIVLERDQGPFLAEICTEVALTLREKISWRKRKFSVDEILPVIQDSIMVVQANLKEETKRPL